MEFQAEAKRERKISRQFRAAKDEIDLRQSGTIQCVGHGAGGRRFVEAHLLLRVELSHQFQQRGEVLIRDKLKKRIHNRDSKRIAIL